MLEDAIKALVASMSDLAKSNRELAGAYANARTPAVLGENLNQVHDAGEVATAVEKTVAEVVSDNALINLDEIAPDDLFLLVVVHGDKPLTVADLNELKINPPTKKLLDIAAKISKAYAAGSVKAKYYGHVLVEMAQAIVDNLGDLKTQKDFNAFWEQLEFAKPDERSSLKYKPPVTKAKPKPELELELEPETDLEFDDVPDYKALREQGASLIPAASKANRDGLVKLLRDFECVTAESKLSFGAAKDSVLVELVPALQTLIEAAAAAAAAAAADA